MMNPTVKAAELLLTARKSGHKLLRLPPDCRPTCVADAYLIQRHVAEKLGGIAGWKINQQSAIAGLTCAPLPAAGVMVESTHQALHLFQTQSEVGIEVELGFVLRKDLPPALTSYTLDQVIDAIDYACIAIEFVESRYQSVNNVDYLSRLADFSSHGAAIFKAHGATRFAVDFQLDLEAQLSLDTGVSHQARYQSMATPPLGLVMWLANHGPRHFGGLKQGQLIITGSCFPILYAGSGTHVQASLSKLGCLQFRLT